MSLADAFNNKAHAWEEYTQTAAGRLREELQYRYLVPHLPAAPCKILDAGSGTGSLGIRLATLGYTVDLLDIAEQMLTIAEQKAARANVHLQCLCQPIETLAADAVYDVVICHTLLEYVSNVDEVLQLLGRAVRPGGLLSLVFVNRYADVFSLALSKGQLTAAKTALSAHSSPADLFGVPRQTFDSGTMQEKFVEWTLTSAYGVRIFADYLLNGDWKDNPARYDELLNLEMAASQQHPFVHIGRYSQMIFEKGV